MAAVTASIGEQRFVVMRFKRIKTWGHVYHVRRHNTREMECRHLEKDALPPRLIVGTADVASSIRKVLDRYGVKHKAGEVLALEYVVSTSRVVFDGLEGDERERQVIDFVVCSLRAFCDRFRIEGQIVSAALHEDERTPHLHVVVVPLINEPDNRRKDKAPIYRLSAKRVIGGRGDMSREQTRFASFFAEMGLERGKERSGARHVSNRQHEALLEQARQAALAEREGLARDRRKIAEVAIQLSNERDALAVERQRFAGAIDQFKADHEKLDADRARIERERAELDVERARLRDEAARLAAGRTAAMEKVKEAEALKDRAIKRTLALRGVLMEGEKFRAQVRSLSAARRTSAMMEASLASQRLAASARAASQDDEWLATMLAYHGGMGSEIAG